MASRAGYPLFKAFTNAGALLVGGKLYTYEPGTTTNKATYTDAGATTPHTNPIILDAAGEAEVFISGNTKFVLKDADDVQIWSKDNIIDSVSSTESLSGVSGVDTITANAANPPTAYAAGQSWTLTSAGANTGAVTLNISGLGARAVTRNGATALEAGDIPSGASIMLIDDGTRLQIANPAIVSATTTKAGKVELATNAETVTGTDTARAITPANATAKMSAPGPIGDTTPSTGAFTTVNGRDIAADGSALDIVVIGATRQTFTTSGTWTKPSGCKKALARVLGGGGAGGGVTGSGTGNAGGAGGGGGGYAEKMIDVSAIASSTITIGAGGTGVSGAAGNAGGDSTWADGTNTVTGGGGGGGSSVASSATSTHGGDASIGAGGAGTGGDVNGTGTPGDRTNTDNNFSTAMGGDGGDSILGGGGKGSIANNTSTAGIIGSGYGGGGGGASNELSATNEAGGNGTDGIIIVEEFY